MTDIRTAGAWGVVSYGEAFVDGVWKRLIRSEVYIAGAWKTGETYAPALTAAASPTSVTGFSYGGGTAVTNTTTVTPTGGLGPYTYAWVRVSGLGGITAPTNATTAFFTTLPGGGDQSGVFRCTVTDSLGTIATADVYASFFDVGV